MNVFFYIFSLLLIVGALGVITSRNPVHAVLWLIFSFCQASGLFLLLGAEFIAMTLIIVYVGAVAVLFLFTVMMLNFNTKQDFKKIAFKNITLNLVIFIGLFVDFILVALIMFKGYEFKNKSNFLIQTDISNTHNIGKVLYTDFFIPFQSAGLMLFLAMIGCVALTFKGKIIRKKTDFYQARKVTMVKAKIGEGVDV
ncbi:MAG: NADH-quinone oxidoreductase subunit J [Rickettsiaceae bacterium]|nr:NADH-quinone oxidoreductase subunit J [Rickettsiaceae bacterium]